MNKHTPGPWHLEETPQGFIITKGPDPFDEQIADHVYTKENAQIMAVAPDLLDAAQLALKIAESWIYDQLDGTSSIDGALRHLDPVRAAIARARGEV